MSAALAANETSIWIKNGTYIETSDCQIINNYTSITGESTGGVQIILTGGLSIESSSNTVTTLSDIDITTGTKIVTLNTGSFPVGATGMHIKLNHEYYKVATRDSAVQVTLENEYKGRTIANGVSRINLMYSGIQLSSFSVIGQNGATVNTEDLLFLPNLYNSTLKELFVSTTDLNCYHIDNGANITLDKCIAWNAGADSATVFASGFLLQSDSVKVSTCSAANCNYAGIFPQGSSITIENSNFNNNRYGSYINANAETKYIFDSCTFDSNTENNIFTSATANSVSLTNCTLSNCPSVAAYFQGEGVALNGNTFVQNVGAVRLKDDSVLTGNTFRLNTGNVIYIEGDDVTAANNTIDGGSNGFYIASASNCMFAKNRIKNCTDGIEMTGTGADNTFESNDIRSNTTGIKIAVGYTNTNLVHNRLSANGTDISDSSTTTQIIDDSAEALLQATSTTKGILIKPMTAVQASAITPAEGLLLFVSSTDATFLSVGYWAYESGVWKKL